MSRLAVYKLKRIARILLGCVALITGGCLGLRDVRVTVPTAILRCQSASLLCHFDLEGESLYSVKWYKGRREFYRFTPNEVPASKVFPLHGLLVDQKLSNDTHLMLTKVDLNMSGRYSCEVSADAPSFHTFLVSGDMDVVEIPIGQPTITGVRPRYHLGDVLHGNCSSSWSRPAAKLNWLVNDVQAPPNHLVYYPPRKDSHSERESSQLGLQLPVKPHHFEQGHLKIRCIASIHDVYWQSTEKSVEEDRPRGVHLEAVGPEFIPKLPHHTTPHPRFLDDMDDDYGFRGKLYPASAAWEPRIRGWQCLSLPLLTPLLLSIVR